MGTSGGGGGTTQANNIISGVLGVSAQNWIFCPKKASNTGASRQYYQDLTAQTTTSTTPVSIFSTNMQVYISSRVSIDIVVRGSNNTLADGLTVGLYSGSSSGALTTLLDSETYTQEGLASNEHTFVLHYELTGLSAGGLTPYISIAINSITGGTASAKIVKYLIEEITC